MTTNVLILCTHNSARSVLSEGMLNHLALKLGIQNEYQSNVQQSQTGNKPNDFRFLGALMYAF